MGSKGLCSTCVSDNQCLFQKQLPVVCCEEFNDDLPKLKKFEELEESGE